MAEEKKPWTVIQASDIEGTLYAVNDTVMLTETEALYREDVNVVRGVGNFAASVTGQPGEHKEKPIEVLEETRIMKEPELVEDADRAAKRPTRNAKRPPE